MGTAVPSNFPRFRTSGNSRGDDGNYHSEAALPKITIWLSQLLLTVPFPPFAHERHNLSQQQQPQRPIGGSIGAAFWIAGTPFRLGHVGMIAAQEARAEKRTRQVELMEAKGSEAKAVSAEEEEGKKA